MAKPLPTIGELLRQKREEAGLSIRRLAELSGVNQANISRLERGEASRPMLSSLTRLAEALGADAAEFYAASGQSTDTTLPSFRPYLRAKYGHLPPDKLDELSTFFETIESEQAAKKAKRRTPRTKSNP